MNSRSLIKDYCFILTVVSLAVASINTALGETLQNLPDEILEKILLGSGNPRAQEVCKKFREISPAAPIPLDPSNKRITKLNLLAKSGFLSSKQPDDAQWTEWSSDGTKILTILRDGTFKVFDAKTGALIATSPKGFGVRYPYEGALRFAEDGESIEVLKGRFSIADSNYFADKPGALGVKIKLNSPNTLIPIGINSYVLLEDMKDKASPINWRDAAFSPDKKSIYVFSEIQATGRPPEHLVHIYRTHGKREKPITIPFSEEFDPEELHGSIAHVTESPDHKYIAVSTNEDLGEHTDEGRAIVKQFTRIYSVKGGGAPQIEGRMIFQEHNGHPTFAGDSSEIRVDLTGQKIVHHVKYVEPKPPVQAMEKFTTKRLRFKDAGPKQMAYKLGVDLPQAERFEATGNQSFPPATGITVDLPSYEVRKSDVLPEYAFQVYDLKSQKTLFVDQFPRVGKWEDRRINAVENVRYSSNGIIFGVKSTDGQLVVWNMKSQRPILRLTGKNAPIIDDFNISPDGKLLYLKSKDKKLGYVVYDLQPNEDKWSKFNSQTGDSKN